MVIVWLRIRRAALFPGQSRNSKTGSANSRFSETGAGAGALICAMECQTVDLSTQSTDLRVRDHCHDAPQSRPRIKGVRKQYKIVHNSLFSPRLTTVNSERARFLRTPKSFPPSCQSHAAFCIGRMPGNWLLHCMAMARQNATAAHHDRCLSC